MIKQVSFTPTTASLIIAAALIIGAGGGYLVSSNSLQPKVRTLEEQRDQLTTENSALTSEVASLEAEVKEHDSFDSALESNITEYQSQLADMQSELSELQVMASAQPIRISWNKIGGTPQDTIIAGIPQAYLGVTSLSLHENGGDAENCRAEANAFQGYSSFTLEASFRIDGATESWATIKLKNENQQHTISVTCIVDRHWAYLSLEGWIEIEGLPVPRNSTWHQMKIIGDGDLDRFKVSIDESESDWIPSEKPWETIDYIEFRGNSNYPSDARLQNIAMLNNSAE